jgi:hypothetical protein
MFSEPRMIILLFLVFYFLENAVHMCNDVSLMLLFNLFANLSRIFVFNLHMESQRNASVTFWVLWGIIWLL